MAAETVLESIITDEAAAEMVSIFEDAGKEDKNIMLDVGMDDEGNIHLQLASVTVDGEDDETYLVHKHSSGLTLYVESEKLKYFEEMKIVVREVEAEEGTEKLFIFVPKQS